MNRKVLLVEPNYKNKYPPMGLMKLATYFRESGDDVRFFKGNLQDLVIDLDVDDLVANLQQVDSSVNWNRYKPQFRMYFKYGRIAVLDEIKPLESDIIAYEVVRSARKEYKNEDYFTYPRFDFVGITTLFTFYFDITIDTINFAKKLCKSPSNVMVGGVMSTILPEKVYEATGIRPFVGQLDKPGLIDEGDSRIIDHLPLDYSILEEIDYHYPAKNAYFAYMTRGCVNHCSFCAVPTLEPTYCGYIGLKAQIEATKARFGEQRDLLLLDNNVLASESFEKIISEIRECGFEKGAVWTQPNQYRITIQNLLDCYNVRAYIRKSIAIYKEIMPNLSAQEKGEFYRLLETNDLLSPDTATRDAILSIDATVAPLYEKTHPVSKSKRRTVDFNQGLDSRKVTAENMKVLSTTCIRPLRIAFDHWSLRDEYVKAVKAAVGAGITHLSNYMLYNFTDEPVELYRRMKLNVELCEELDADIYSFPMKYHPIDDEQYFMNRDYIGANWSRKFVRAVQAVLNSTKGCIGRGLDFFYEAFGKDEQRFDTILWMPEAFIIYRMKFKENLAQDWETKFYSLPADDLELVKSIVSENKFTHMDLSIYNNAVAEVLQYYQITRDMAAEM